MINWYWSDERLHSIVLLWYRETLNRFIHDCVCRPSSYCNSDSQTFHPYSIHSSHFWTFCDCVVDRNSKSKTKFVQFVENHILKLFSTIQCKTQLIFFKYRVIINDWSKFLNWQQCEYVSLQLSILAGYLIWHQVCYNKIFNMLPIWQKKITNITSHSVEYPRYFYTF